MSVLLVKNVKKLFLTVNSRQYQSWYVLSTSLGNFKGERERVEQSIM